MRKMIRQVISRIRYRGRKPSNKPKDSKIKELISLARQNKGRKRKKGVKL